MNQPSRRNQTADPRSPERSYIILNRSFWSTKHLSLASHDDSPPKNHQPMILSPKSERASETEARQRPRPTWVTKGIGATELRLPLNARRKGESTRPPRQDRIDATPTTGPNRRDPFDWTESTRHFRTESTQPQTGWATKGNERRASPPEVTRTGMSGAVKALRSSQTP
jgi:hypothetical protein